MKSQLTSLILLANAIFAVGFTLPVIHAKPAKNTGAKLQVTSPVFSYGSIIPLRYTCSGQNVNPPLDIANVPPNTMSLAIIVDDPDAPNGTFTHWIAWDLPAHASILESSNAGTQGENGAMKSGYTGPCPPSGTHRYFFKVYALDINLNLPLGSTRANLEAAMKGHIIGEGELMGKFSK